MKDAKGHGSDARGGSAEKIPLNRTAHSFKKRKHDQRGGGGGGGGGGTSSGGGGGQGGGGSMHPKSGNHTLEIHKAVGKNLAQLSAAATNPAIPPPVIGGRK